MLSAIDKGSSFDNNFKFDNVVKFHNYSNETSESQVIFCCVFIHADGSAGEMVNPSKTAAQVNTESLEGKELYKVSHNDFDVGKFRNDYHNIRNVY